MRILVTGSNGFIGRNLVETLKYKFKDGEIYKYDIDNSIDELKEFVNNSDCIIHLAGVNRPLTNSDFYTGNVDFTRELCNIIEKTGKKKKLIVSSSIHVNKDSDYGKSKKMAEEYLEDFALRTMNKVIIFRLTNVFGKWAKPNYNSVVATFCYNIARDLPINIHDEKLSLVLAHIDDVVTEFIDQISSDDDKIIKFLDLHKKYEVTIGEIALLIESFKRSRNDKSIPNVKDDFVKKLHSTYLTYIPINNLSYDLDMNVDDRGSFTEFIRTLDKGQISINISKPGIVKGNHWHHTKNEKFLVIAGSGVIRFRSIINNEVYEYNVSEKKLEVIDIPAGYTHNIENTGQSDMVTIIWANELYNPEKPDTFFMEV